MSHHTMLSKYGNCTRLLKIENKLGVFSKTIFSLALVRYEMIIANSALRASLASLPCHIQRALVE